MRKSLVLALILLIGHSASAQKRYDAGASDTEIRIGNTSPYSGPASSYATVPRAQPLTSPK